MFFKLALSLAIAAPLVAEVHRASTGAPSLLWLGLVVVAAGYHRNLLDEHGRIPWFRVVLPTSERMRVRHSVWGIPLAPARRVRVGPRVRRRAEGMPWLATLVELLPAVLRWGARKAGI